MDSEDAILQEFLESGLPYLDAIKRLEGIGYEPTDAERLVDECIEAHTPTETGWDTENTDTENVRD